MRGDSRTEVLAFQSHQRSPLEKPAVGWKWLAEQSRVRLMRAPRAEFLGRRHGHGLQVRMRPLMTISQLVTPTTGIVYTRSTIPDRFRA